MVKYYWQKIFSKQGSNKQYEKEKMNRKNNSSKQYICKVGKATLVGPNIYRGNIVFIKSTVKLLQLSDIKALKNKGMTDETKKGPVFIGQEEIHHASVGIVSKFADGIVLTIIHGKHLLYKFH